MTNFQEILRMNSSREYSQMEIALSSMTADNQFSDRKEEKALRKENEYLNAKKYIWKELLLKQEQVSPSICDITNQVIISQSWCQCGKTHLLKNVYKKPLFL